MRILITGGSGFLGKPLIRQLIAAKHELIAITRSVPQNSSEGIKWVQSSLLLQPQTLEELKAFNPEVVIHLAWEKIPDFSFETSFENLQNHISFFNKIFTFTSVKKIIVAGSCFECHKKQGVCIESEQAPSGNYFTWAKNSLKDFLLFECLKNNITFAWARIFYVYGPGQRSDALIPVIINSLRDGKAPDIRTPANANDFVYVDDVAAGFKKMVEKDFDSGIYNLGSGTATGVSEILALAEKIIRNDDTLTKLVLKNASGSVADINFWADGTKSKEILGWQPLVSIEYGIRQMLGTHE